jgi:hypothetical protein
MHRFRLLTFASLAALTLSCGGDSKPSLGDRVRTAFAPPAVPPDTIPEMLNYAADLGVNLAEMAKLPSGVLYGDLAPGDLAAAPAAQGDSVSIQFEGWLPDATKVDSGTARFRIGGGGVLLGLEYTVPGMRPGGRRKLVLPPGLAFGPEGSDLVPPNAVLVYDLQLIAIIR